MKIGKRRVIRDWGAVARLLVGERLAAGLTQEEAAAASGVGVKTLSSFETGARVESMKVRQLVALLGVYGTDVGEFLGGMDR